MKTWGTSRIGALALIDRDPAAGILAAADLREQRAKTMPTGLYGIEDHGLQSSYSREGGMTFGGFEVGILCEGDQVAIVGDAWDAKAAVPTAEHIAAEANPAHALAAVRRWRGVVERHAKVDWTPTQVWPDRPPVTESICRMCVVPRYPCPDLTETADEARAYLGGAV